MMSCPGVYFLVFDMSDCICWHSSKMRVNLVPHWLQSNFNWSNGADNLNHRDITADLTKKVFSLLHMSRAWLLPGNYWNFLSWQLSKEKYLSLHPSTCTRLNYTDIIPYVGPLGLISIGEGILLVDTKWQLLKNKLNEEMCKKLQELKSILIDPHVNMSNLTGSKSMFASKWFWSLWIFSPFIRTLWKVWLFNSICVLLVLKAFIQTQVEKANLHWVALSLLNTVYGW